MTIYVTNFGQLEVMCDRCKEETMITDCFERNHTNEQARAHASTNGWGLATIVWADRKDINDLCPECSEQHY